MHISQSTLENYGTSETGVYRSLELCTQKTGGRNIPKYWWRHYKGIESKSSIQLWKREGGELIRDDTAGYLYIILTTW